MQAKNASKECKQRMQATNASKDCKQRQQKKECKQRTQAKNACNDDEDDDDMSKTRVRPPHHILKASHQEIKRSFTSGRLNLGAPSAPHFYSFTSRMSTPLHIRDGKPGCALRTTFLQLHIQKVNAVSHQEGSTRVRPPHHILSTKCGAEGAPGFMGS